VRRSKTTTCLACRIRKPFPCECNHERKRCTEAVSFEIPTRRINYLSCERCTEAAIHLNRLRGKLRKA